MAVLAVFLLLALAVAGARACEEQQGSPGAPPPPPPTPPPTPSSTPDDGFEEVQEEGYEDDYDDDEEEDYYDENDFDDGDDEEDYDDATEVPPTPASPADLPPMPPPRLPKRRTALPLYKYALLNSARMQGRGIVHRQTEDSEDYCACGDKLYNDALQYRKLGAVERWCVEYPEDLQEMGPDYDDENYHLCSEEMHPTASPQRELPSVYDGLKCTATMPPITHLANTSITPLFTDQQTQSILPLSPSRPVSSDTCNPESEPLALQNVDRQSVVNQTADDLFLVHPSRMQPYTSDTQSEANLREGTESKVENECYVHSYDSNSAPEILAAVGLRVVNVQSDHKPTPMQSENTVEKGYRGHSYHSVRSAPEIRAPSLLSTMLSSQVELSVNVQSDNEPTPVHELHEIPDESMEVDDGDDRSDGSSIASDVARVGSSDESDSDSVMTLDDFMDVFTTNTEPDDVEVDGESSVPDFAVELVVGMPTQQMEEAVTQQWQADTMEQASNLQLPSPTPEPQPGPSGVWRPPSSSPKPPNISFPDYPGTRYSRNREPLIYSAAGYPGSEMYGYLKPLDWVPPPPEDMNKELNRIFGVQEDSEESSPHQSEVNYCLGELKVAMLGTNVRPLYVVYVKCHIEGNNCPPRTECSEVGDSFSVANRKDVPIRQQVFRLMGDPKDKWQPVKLQVPTACFCAPPDYQKMSLNIFTDNTV